MSPRTRRLSWLAGIILVLLGLGYAGLPWMLETLLTHTLAAQGLRNIRVAIDYPGWHAIRLRSLSFTMLAGDKLVQVQLPSAEIEYRLTGLVRGNVERILVPRATLAIQPALHEATDIQANTAGQAATSQLAALFSGQWLAQIPVGEMSLDRLNVTWHATPKTSYAMQLHASFQNARLVLKGDIKLPQIAKRIAFSFHADHQGKAGLLFSSVADNKMPLLEISVTSVDVGHEPKQLKGEWRTRLQSLLPILQPWLKQTQQVSDVKGDLQSQWQLQLKESGWRLSGEALLHGFTGQWHHQRIPMSEGMAKYNLDAKQATLHAGLNAAKKAVVLQIDGVQHFNSGRGLAEIRLMPVMFKKKVFTMSQLFTTWPYPFDVNAGQASAAIQLHWSKIVTSTAQIYLKQIAGQYNKVAFSGVNGEMALSLDNGITSSKTARLHVAMLDVGFPVENIDARFMLTLPAGKSFPAFKVQKVSAELLGGRAYTGPFNLDLNRDKNGFVVQLEHIDLAKIMQLEQQEGIQASGLLDGQVPIILSRKGIAVDKGLLAERAPGGVIRYTPTPKVLSLAQSNSSVSLLVDALRNFHYKVMKVKTDYKTSGDLNLHIHIEGRNPDWQAGKPVHLNLNLQENIPVLLRSLQLGGEITERVGQHYQTAPQ